MNWLFLRGLAREQRHWGHMLESFEARVPNAKTYCIDLPGAGTEYQVTCPLTIAGMVAQMRPRFLELKEKHPGEWGIFGISLGGMITMHWAGNFPSDFQRVVMANTSAANLSVPWRRIDFTKLPGIVGALAESDRVMREKRIMDMTTCVITDAEKMAIAQKHALFQADFPMARTNVIRQLAAATRHIAPEKIQSPVLVLSGGHDPFTDPGCHKRIAEYFHAPLRVHPEAGHDLSLDAPDWVSDEIATWCAST